MSDNNTGSIREKSKVAIAKLVKINNYLYQKLLLIFGCTNIECVGCRVICTYKCARALISNTGLQLRPHNYLNRVKLITFVLVFF